MSSGEKGEGHSSSGQGTVRLSTMAPKRRKKATVGKRRS
jgi:hypothetical protein